MAKTKKSIPPLLIGPDDYIHNDQDKAEHFASQFEANHIHRTPTNPQTDCHTFLVEEKINEYFLSTLHDDTITQTTPSEIKNIIKRLKNLEGTW